MSGSVPISRGSVNEGSTNAAGYSHEGRGGHKGDRSFSEVAQTVFGQFNDAISLRGHEKIFNWTMATDYTDIGSHYESAIKFGSRRLDVKGARCGPPRARNDIQSG